MEATASQHPQDLVANSPMTRPQYVAIALCVLINFMDGFDLLSIAFTAPIISKTWDVGMSQLGIVFAAGGLGMLIGAFFVGPMADYRGRRFVILVSLGVIAFGMLATIFTSSVPELFAARVVTGIGLGGVLPSLNTLVAEYSSDKYRNICITMLHLAFPIGGAAGGVAANVIISQFGWEGVFVLGGVIALLMLPIAFFLLPESIDYHLIKRGPESLGAVNKVLKGMGHDELRELPDVRGLGSNKEKGVFRLFSADLVRANLLLPLCFFMLMLNLYVMLQWTPTLVVALGHTQEQGVTASVITSFTTAIGMLMFGLVATKYELKTTEMITSFLAAAAMLTLGIMAESPFNVLAVLFGVMGFTNSGLMVGLYALAPRVYPPTARSAGISMSVGIGRIATFVGPALAGFLLASGLTPGGLMMLLAIPLLVPGLAVLAIPYASIPATDSKPPS